MSELSTAKKALLVVAVANAVMCLVALAIEGVVPSAIVFPVVLAVGCWRMLRSPDRGALFLLVAGVVFLLVHVPFLPEAASDSCVHPLDETRACNEGLWLAWLGAAPVALIATAAIAWAQDRRAPRVA